MPDHDRAPQGLADIVTLPTLKRHRLLLTLTTLLAVGGVAGYLAVAEPVYEAEARVVIQHLGLGLDGTAGTKTYDRELLSTQAEVIRSPLIIGRSLEAVPLFAPPEPDTDPIEAILEDLRVIPLANTDVVRVTYQHSDAEHATARLRSILDSYQAQLREAEQTSAGESFALLTNRERELRAELDALQKQLAEVRSDVPTAGAGADAIGDERSLLNELTARWAAVRAERAWLAATLAGPSGRRAYVSSRSGVRLQNETAAALADLQAALHAARTELEEFSRVYGPQHPERISRERRVAVLTEQLAEQQALLDAEYEQRSIDLEAEEQTLQTLVEDERRRLEEFDAALLEEERLVAEIERVSELHRSTLATLEAVGLADRALAEGRASLSVRVIDRYAVPTEPVWPQPLPLLGAGVLLGLLLGIACCAALEARRSRLAVNAAAAPATAAVDDPEAAVDLETAVARETMRLREMIHESPDATRTSASEPATV